MVSSMTWARLIAIVQSSATKLVITNILSSMGYTNIILNSSKLYQSIRKASGYKTWCINLTLLLGNDRNRGLNVALGLHILHLAKHDFSRCIWTEYGAFYCDCYDWPGRRVGIWISWKTGHHINTGKLTNIVESSRDAYLSRTHFQRLRSVIGWKWDSRQICARWF